MDAAAGAALICGARGYADLCPTHLDDLLPPGALTVDARVRPTLATDRADIFTHDCATGRARLLLDPLGSLAFRGGLPRTWLMTPYFEGFPASAFTIELSICPFRGQRSSTLLSYSSGADSQSSDRTPDLLIEERPASGIVVSIGRESVATGLYFDYCQWQHLAVSWSSESGELTIYRDDRDKTVATVLDPRIDIRMTAPAFRGTLARGHRLPADGSLVIGQRQQRRADIAAFDPMAAYVGYLAGARIWDHVRGLDAINADRDRWLTGTEPGLAAAYAFSHLAASCAEALNLCSDDRNIGQLGGVGADELLHDRRWFRVIAHAGGAGVASAPVIRADRWSAVTMTATRRRLPRADETETRVGVFVDGEELTLRPLPARWWRWETERTCRIGPVAHGQLHDVRVWSTRRSGDEIRRDRDARLRTPQPDLRACYIGELDDRGRVIDRSGHDRHLVMRDGLTLAPLAGAARRISAP